MVERRPIITLCNAGKERSRMLACTLEDILSKKRFAGKVLARGTFGLGEDEKGVSTKYGWVPPEGFVHLLKSKGVNLPTYPSQKLSEDEARDARYLIAVDPTIAERVRRAFPQYSSKVLTALEAIDPEHNPFHDFLNYSIPDAWGGHLSEQVRKVLHNTEGYSERASGLSKALGEELNEESQEFVRRYDPAKVDPTDIKKIPAQLRDYMGHKLDTDEAYLQEAENLREVAEGLHKRGYFKE